MLENVLTQSLSEQISGQVSTKWNVHAAEVIGELRAPWKIGSRFNQVQVKVYIFIFMYWDFNVRMTLVGLS